MFIIIHNLRRFTRKSFTNYEEARSFVRKYLRTKYRVSKMYANSNAAINDYGFSVVKAA